MWSPLVQFVGFSERSDVLLQPLCEMCNLVEDKSLNGQFIYPAVIVWQHMLGNCSLGNKAM